MKDIARNVMKRIGFMSVINVCACFVNLVMGIRDLQYASNAVAWLTPNQRGENEAVNIN